MENRVDRLHGDISLAIPMSWQVIGYLLVTTLAIAFIFLASASYSRVETVAGEVALDTGVAPLVASRAGIVAALAAREGQTVATGQRLALIRSEEALPQGDTGPERILAALRQRDDRLDAQISRLADAASADQSRLDAQLRGLTEEVARIEEQIEDQRRLVEVARDEFQEARRIAGNGFLSRRDLNAREGTLLARRQQLSQLRQSRARKSSEIAEARQAHARSRAAAAADAAAVESSRAHLGEETARTEVERGYSLAAPVAGRVTAVTARAGQPVAQGQTLLIVVPARGRIRVDLHVPTRAAGFLAPGQEVRVAVDAFPAERFGAFTGRIVEISSVAIPRRSADGTVVPVYLVSAELPRPWVATFGRKQPLLPGMTLTARIVTRRQSLLSWVFEPLFAVRRR